MDCTKRVVQNKAMKIGYGRVSTDEQNLDLQLDALKKAGCEKIFTDEGISGITLERDGLSQALLGIGQGDVLVGPGSWTVWGALWASCASWWNGSKNKAQGFKA
jgi:hypothetical protein